MSLRAMLTSGERVKLGHLVGRRCWAVALLRGAGAPASTPLGWSRSSCSRTLQWLASGAQQDGQQQQLVLVLLAVRFSQ
jgi:hypothetical protein